jgi:cell division protein FtsQ
MFKKILIYTGYTILFASLAAYFVLSSMLEKQESSKVKCRKIEITVLDSAVNRFVTIAEIRGLIQEEGINVNESKLRHINLHELENILNNRTAIRRSIVNYSGQGILHVRIEQRRPVLRLETENGGFYMDETAYMFPLVKSFTSYVPVVTGFIPLNLVPGYRGRIKENMEWAEGMLELGLFIDKNELLNAQVEQIFIDEKGDLHIIPRVGQHEIVFGKPDNVEAKFEKLMAFYNHVIPNAGWDKYKTISLQYSNQIVCTKRDNKTKNNKNLNI